MFQLCQVLWLFPQELQQDKVSLQKELHDQMNQISQLKSQVENLKLGADKYHTEQVEELQKLLKEEREAHEGKDKEVRA